MEKNCVPNVLIFTSNTHMFAYKKKVIIFAGEFAGVAQLVEHDLAKVGVAGSSPVSRSNKKGPS
jgi:hypothetical protein